MLKLSKNDGTPIGDFKNYMELYKYIRDQENAKLLEDHPEFGQTAWSFLEFTPERVVELYNTLKKEYNLETLSRAAEQGSGLIEMRQGDLRNPRLIVSSPDVKVELHRKDFCDDWCQAHKLVLTECDH